MRATPKGIAQHTRSAQALRVQPYLMQARTEEAPLLVQLAALHIVHAEGRLARLWQLEADEGLIAERVGHILLEGKT